MASSVLQIVLAVVGASVAIWIAIALIKETWPLVAAAIRGVALLFLLDLGGIQFNFGGSFCA